MITLSQPGSDWPPNRGANSHLEIDGDLLVYSCGFAAEGEPIEHCLYTVKAQLRQIVLGAGCDSWNVHLTHEDVEENFRYKVATIQPYKGNRGDSGKPTHYSAIREYMMEHWNGILHVGFEADDALAISHHRNLSPCTPESDISSSRPGVVLASLDKDLRGVQGAILYNWNEGKREYLKPLEALRWFYTQCLTGDKVDNIKGLSLTRPEGKALGGVRSVGMKSPWVLGLEELTNEEQMYYYVLDAYRDRQELLQRAPGELSEPLTRVREMGPEEALRENATLLHMLEYEGQVWEKPNASE